MKVIFLLTIIFVICYNPVLGQIIINGGFENWQKNNAGVLEPENWETQNEPELQLVENSEGHTGLHSACLSIVWDNMIKKFTGGLMSTENDIKITKSYKYLSGYYIGGINNVDTLNVNINIYSKNKLVGSGYSGLLNTKNEWVEFCVSINYYSNEKPETAKISFSINPVPGSHYQTKYCIDDLIFAENNNK